MNGAAAALVELEAIKAMANDVGCDVVVCPPSTLVERAVRAAAGSQLAIGAQDCHALASGAYTGNVSAEMLADAGATHVILGHSERRSLHGEADALVLEKTSAAHRAGLIAIVCVGETEDERNSGTALDVVRNQLAGSLPATATDANTVIAYEPVWAIGSGLVPSLEQIGEVHAEMRRVLVARFGAAGKGMRLLYGGSVKGANAATIFSVADVDGALVGGASLKAVDFAPIVSAAAG